MGQSRPQRAGLHVAGGRIERQQGKQGEAEAEQPQTDQKERQIMRTDPQAGDGHELAVASTEPTEGE